MSECPYRRNWECANPKSDGTRANCPSNTNEYCLINDAYSKDAFIILPYKGVLHTVVLDVEDYEKYKHIKWHITNKSRHANSPKLYVRHNTRRRREGKQIGIYLHRLIANALPGVVVDHIDNNSLNCRRANLKCVTVSENARKQDHALQRARGY